VLAFGRRSRRCYNHLVREAVARNNAATPAGDIVSGPRVAAIIWVLPGAWPPRNSTGSLSFTSASWTLGIFVSVFHGTRNPSSALWLLRIRVPTLARALHSAENAGHAAFTRRVAPVLQGRLDLQDFGNARADVPWRPRSWRTSATPSPHRLTLSYFHRTEPEQHRLGLQSRSLCRGCWCSGAGAFDVLATAHRGERDSRMSGSAVSRAEW